MPEGTRHLTLALDERYDPATQSTIAFQAAQLDLQLADLKEVVEDLEVLHLEWQALPGHNTIGMLLAHIAVAEAFWMKVAVQGLYDSAQADVVMHEVIGIGKADDGLPLGDCGQHPDTLRRRTVPEYLMMIDAARAATHEVLLSWTDADLATEVRLADWTVSYGWVLYHVLEHLSQHVGQIRRLVRDARAALA